MATITVTNTLNTGAGSLRQAITDASAGDTITFSNAISGGTITLTSGELAIAKNLTIDGDLNNDGTADITVSGNNASRILNITGGGNTIAIDGLTLTSGSVAGNGGAVSVAAATLTVTNSTIQNSAATGSFSGGGLYGGSSATITVTNSTITGNSASLGGGVRVRNNASLTINDSTVSSNTGATYGGGVTVTNGASLTMNRSTVTGNTVSGETSANHGGGGILLFAPATITNSTISGNSAVGHGGGIAVNGSGGTLKIYNTTVTNNRSDSNDNTSGDGGGIARNGSGNVGIYNSVVAGNFKGTGTTVNDVLGTIPVATNSFFGGTATVTTATSSPTATTTADDPGLGALASNGGTVQTHAISASTSPLVNAGSNSLVAGGVTTDSAGNTRIQNGTVDIGAFESAFSPPSTGGGGGGGGGGDPTPGGPVITTPQGTGRTGGGAPTASSTVTNSGGEPGTANIVENTDNNGNVVTASLPPSIQIDTDGPTSAQSPTDANSTLTTAIQGRGTADSEALVGEMQNFLNAQASSTTVDIRTLVPTLNSGVTTSDPIILTGTTGSNQSEAFVIDMRSITGRELQLENIEFASIIGSAIVSGGAGNNYAVGDGSAQFMALGDGADTIVGGGGNDTAGGGVDTDILYGNLNDDILYGNQGTDTLFGGQDDDVAYGGQDADVAYGNLGSDLVYGNLGSDTLFGGQDNDTVVGGQGDDLVYGNIGDDRLVGGLGNDTLTGGAGADVHVFGDGGGSDQIGDFTIGEDLIEIPTDINGSGIQSFLDLVDGLSTNADGNVEIDLGSGNTITLIGVSPDQLAADSFTFL